MTRLWMAESLRRSDSTRPLPWRRMARSVSSASSNTMVKRPMPSCATVLHQRALDEAVFGSIDVDRRVDPEHVLCRHQDVASVRAWRHVLAGQHLQGQRQDLAAV